jgi:RNA polymerase sigma factor (sigma-70 family)
VVDPDQDILASLKTGNARAFAALVDRHKDRALTYALRIVGRREEAEELVQDSFVRAYRSLEQFRGDSRFGTWFTRILHNLCMTHVTRRTTLEVPLEDDSHGGGNGHYASEDPDALERLEEEERNQILNSEIARLPLNYRQALTLFYVQELSYEEIAQATGLPLGTMKTHLFRARSLLKKNLLIRREAENTSP